jgi:hypothetical protein
VVSGDVDGFVDTGTDFPRDGKRGPIAKQISCTADYVAMAEFLPKVRVRPSYHAGAMSGMWYGLPGPK